MMAFNPFDRSNKEVARFRRIHVVTNWKREVMRSKAESRLSGLAVIMLVSTMLITQWAIGSGVPPGFLKPPRIAVFRGDTDYALLLSWDDGINDEVLAYIEEEFGAHHTSFVVTSQIDERQLWGLDLLFRGHDIQSHSHKHIYHALLNRSYCEWLYLRSVEKIRSKFGYDAILMAYPYGSYGYTSSRVAMEYFNVARGVNPEKPQMLGTWPIPADEVRGCKQSFPLVSGLSGNTTEWLQSSFTSMTKLGVYRAFKCYGHAALFNGSEIRRFSEVLAEIAGRGDTWITSWGEAVAYSIERERTQIEHYSLGISRLTFILVADFNITRFSVPLTFVVEVPLGWTTPTVLDEGRILSSQLKSSPDGRRYVVFDTLPQNQQIVITANVLMDTAPPEVSNLRMMLSDEGVCFMLDITDMSGVVTDVNITITTELTVYSFKNVQNPVFWNNATYGCVVFGLKTGSCIMEVSAVDSSGNSMNLVYEILIHPQ